ncbi:PREDICTED: sulfotransferase 4A1-like [Poecilia mexicana]|uniref:sulfotransferase 4A1-like n=1 Tax=Poecilia mexicana TaxID=48701 RepID=UPI00072DC181|nr:PREDICTED: sulfotransferase 4A1-like [Poecilia mexicana]XP_016520963.1 PREDICTED: sulfotransferase 4A1-like [Poecilia formosa]
MAESEADTPSTPIEFESKYFEFDGVRLPPFCRGKMEDISNFSLRSSDIWIVTYPKSGTEHWMLTLGYKEAIPSWRHEL